MKKVCAVLNDDCQPSKGHGFDCFISFYRLQKHGEGERQLFREELMFKVLKILGHSRCFQGQLLPNTLL